MANSASGMSGLGHSPRTPDRDQTGTTDDRQLSRRHMETLPAVGGKVLPHTGPAAGTCIVRAGSGEDMTGTPETTDQLDRRLGRSGESGTTLSCLSDHHIALSDTQPTTLPTTRPVDGPHRHALCPYRPLPTARTCSQQRPYHVPAAATNAQQSSKPDERATKQHRCAKALPNSRLKSSQYVTALGSRLSAREFPLKASHRMFCRGTPEWSGSGRTRQQGDLSAGACRQ